MRIPSAAMNFSTATTAPKRQKGLTLIELLTVLSILGVLAGLAAPSFTSLFERWQTNKAASTLESALFYARSESIRRGGGLVLIRQSSGENCAETSKADWRCGWVLASTSDKTTVLHASDQTFPNLVIDASSAGDEIHLDRWGGMSLNNTSNSFSFALHHKNKSANDGKNLCIASGGMARQIAGSSSCSN